MVGSTEAGIAMFQFAANIIIVDLVLVKHNLNFATIAQGGIEGLSLSVARVFAEKALDNNRLILYIHSSFSGR
jgi:hypothetical protein